MYLPAAFQNTDLTEAWDAMEAHSFGLLTCQADETPFASHLPFLLDRTQGPYGTLTSHMAKGNPHWRFADGQTVLVIFQGAHHYITPAWYAAENVVPTWNYVAVHALGIFEPVFDTAEILDIVQRSVLHYEQHRPTPWTFDPDTEFAQRMAQAVVGFRIEITRLEGKWKLGQNQTVERRERVIAGLRELPAPESQAMATLIQQTLPPPSEA